MKAICKIVDIIDDFEENKPKLSKKLRTDEGSYAKEFPGKAVTNRIN